MFKRGSSIGLFGRFGRSEDLRRLDEALRALDVHPMTVKEAVKLAAIRLMRDAEGRDDPSPGAYGPAAEIVAYCMMGPDPFAHANGEVALARVERRVERALDHPDALDASLVLLAMKSGIISPVVVDKFGLEAE